MFQYATGLAVAQSLGTELKLDVSHFGSHDSRRLELDRFNITAPIATETEIRQVTGLLGTRNGRYAKAVRSLCARLGPWGRFVTGRYLRSKSFSYDPVVSRVGDGVYLHGLWQSYRYFGNIDERLRDEFSLKGRHEEDQTIGQRIRRDENSVSLHVRRGDYITNGAALPHLPCSISYYQSAIEALRKKLGEISLYVFSDEPEWVMENLNCEGAEIIRLQGPDRGPRDLVLMSECTHHIIANSTFSWWGAWLSKQPEGIVCSPKHWFKQGVASDYPLEDLLPESWWRL